MLTVTVDIKFPQPVSNVGSLQGIRINYPV
jgi:hypothetical protein